MTPFQLILNEYMQKMELNARDFAQLLSENTYASISHQTVYNWISGLYEPHYRTLILFTLKYRDWRREFAFDALAALTPELYSPVGEIGRRILENGAKA